MNRILRPTALVALLAALGMGAAPAAAQSLRGSRPSIDRMYQQARNHDLTFYRTGTGVRGAARDGDLVRLSGNENYRLSGVSYPYALPSARMFVQRLGAQWGYTGPVDGVMGPNSWRAFARFVNQDVYD